MADQVSERHDPLIVSCQALAQKRRDLADEHDRLSVREQAL
jgi:hypothetical protein